MKLRYLLIASSLALIFGIFMIGQNSASAQDLANKLVSMDNVNQPIESAQKDLTNYVHSHMGGSVSVFLNASYQRAVVAANPAPTTSGQVYHDAQAACVTRTTAVNQANCVQAYVNAHATPGATDTQPVQVSKSSYSFNYQAPRWTPDTAGIFIMFGLIGLLSSGLLWLFKRKGRKL